MNEVFAPNALLKITPAFLESLLTHVREEGYRLVSLDEVPALLGVSNPEPFLALTFDDGYRDTLVEALPVLERHAAPFTVFATTGFLDRTARLWWVELERALAKLATVDIEIGGRRYVLPLGNPRQKGAAFGLLRRALLAGGDDDLLAATAKLCASADVDPRALVEELCLDWGELRRLLASPLAALGCHTRTHPRLALQPFDTMQAEMDASRRELESGTGRAVRHVCYPYGTPAAAGPREYVAAAALGYVTGVTTRPGVLSSADASRPTALPRISMNGLWQSTGAVDVLLSGAGFALWNVASIVGAASRVSAARSNPPRPAVPST